ncbi:hypothetical protein SLITO_v1c08180 [Spiroplasma litorale]|uniref:Lipoprotein n=1 Tax=Spiroplasma litorale TaxID=216942 RepID=A0A0K1W279_9MOLU|nr:hypothetical protein [Spiroplasma litorale]AKX34435.1 hypothetical protein SLITO_v1c08180 [Spiroplasma litorale]
MKKLTKLLLSITTISGISSFAVSCSLGSLPGTNNNSSPNQNGGNNSGENNGSTDPNDGNGSNSQNGFNKLLNDFIKDADKIINNHLNENISNLYELDKGDGSLKNEFLKLSVLKEKQSGLNKPVYFTEGDKSNLEQDTLKLIVLDKLNTLIKDLFKEEKYKILKPDESSDISLNIKFETCIITFTTSGNITAANVIFYYDIVVNYKDYSNNISQQKFNNRFVYGITNSELINQTVTNLFNNLRTEGLLNESKHKDLFKLTHEKLKLSDKKSWIVEEKYENLLKTFVNSDEFKNDLITDLNKNYKLEDNVEFSFSNDDNNNVFDTYSSLSLIKGTEENINWKSTKKINDSINLTNKDFYDFLFRENTIMPNSTTTVGGDKTYTVNSKIYQYIKYKFKDIFDNNNKDISKIFAIDNNTIKNNDNLKNSIRTGELRIKNLQLKIGSNFKQQLPKLNVITSFSAEEKDLNYNLASGTFNDDFFENSGIFASIYKNAFLGIKAMKDVYGFKEDDINRNFESLGKQYNWKGLSISNFKGTSENWNNNKNLWDTFNYKPYLLNVQNTLSNNLSLKNSNQKDFLNHILNWGEQEVYNWNFDFDKVSLSCSKFSNQIRKADSFGDVKKIYGSLELNFIKIKFEIDEQLTSQLPLPHLAHELIIFGK